MTKDPATLCLAVGETLIWATILYVFPALILRWEQTLGWSKSELTLGITLAMLLFALCAPIAGRLIDAGRGAAMMGGASLLGAAGLVWLSSVETLWSFYGAWSILGVAMAGTLYEPCFAIVTRARGEDAKRSIIAITLVAGFASTISFPVAHNLSDAFGWRVTVLCFAAVAAFVAGPLLYAGVRMLETARSAVGHEAAPDTPAQRRFLARPTFWLLAFGFMFIAIVQGATLHHLLLIFDDRGVPPETAIVAASFIGPMQVAGRLAMMAGENRATNHGFAIAAFVLIAGAMAALFNAGAALVLVIGFVTLFGAAYGTVSILRPVIAREVLGGNNFGAKAGALAVPYLLGSASAPYLGSLLWGIGGYDLMIAVLMACAGAGGGLYIVARRVARHG